MLDTQNGSAMPLQANGHAQQPIKLQTTVQLKHEYWQQTAKSGISLNGLVLAAWTLTMAAHASVEIHDVIFEAVDVQSQFTLDVDKSSPSRLDLLSQAEKIVNHGGPFVTSHNLNGDSGSRATAAIIFGECTKWPQNASIVVEVAPEHNPHPSISIRLSVDSMKVPSASAKMILQYLATAVRGLATPETSPSPYDGGTPQNLCDLVFSQVQRTPQRIALQFGQEVFLTYRQLDGLTNDLARILIQHGVKRGTPVALYMDKSPEMFLSILGILKAGGCYVPLDPTHPTERVSDVLQHATSSLILVNSSLQTQLSSIVPGFKVKVDVLLVEREALRLDAKKPHVEPLGPRDLCYILFTSGSTGTPKGVVVSHGPVIESVIGSYELIGKRTDRVLQFGDYTFDFSVWDWAATWSVGGTLCMASKIDLMYDLPETARSLDINFIETTPTVVSLIAPEDVPTLQTILMAGEFPTKKIYTTWSEEVHMLNSYGATEAIVISVANHITPTTALADVGHPYGINVVYILDEHRRPVLDGTIGEIFIGGPQMSNGYLGNPTQTAKSFVQDPFRPGCIMYATGDLGQMCPETRSITFMGRRDTQIKVRGKRVDVGELENSLKAVDARILNAVVIKFDLDRETLVAFIELKSDVEAAETTILPLDHELSQVLDSLKAAAQKLPPHMVPSQYVPLAKFPLTTSRKVDRKTLTAFFIAHEQDIREMGRAKRAPNKPVHRSIPTTSSSQANTEATIRTLWAKTFRLSEDALNAEDDFYALGGDSIAAIQLAGGIRNAGYSILATDIISNPTIRAITQFLESSSSIHHVYDTRMPPVPLSQMSSEDLSLLSFDDEALDKFRDGLIGINPSEVLDVYPATPLQNNMLLASLSRSVPDAYIIRQGYDLPPGITPNKLIRAFNDFLNHPNGASLRTQFVLFEEDRFFQVILRPGCRNLEVTLVKVSDEKELDLRMRQYQFQRGAEIFPEGQLLTRICIFEMEGYARSFIWCIHHACSDNWGLTNISADISAIYHGHPIPPRPYFKSFCNYLETHDKTEGIQYWRTKLANVSPTPFLQASPDDPPVNANRNYTSRVHIAQVNSARKQGIMASTLLTTAWAVVLAAHSETFDVVFGQILSGRNVPVRDTNLMTGLCINTVPRRIALSPGASVLATLREVQADQLEINKHEHLTFTEMLPKGVHPSPLVRTLFSVVNPNATQQTHENGSKVADDDLFQLPREDDVQSVDSPFSLSVVFLSQDEFQLKIFYDPNVISKAHVAALMDHYTAALTSMSNNFDQSIRDVNLINPEELSHLLQKDKQHSTHAVSSYRNVCEVFEAQVQRTPQRIALQYLQEAFVTYQDLNNAANRLAAIILSKGVQPRSMVGIFMEKSIEMFVSLLAVFKAGAGYVPLSPNHPTERIQKFIKLSECKFILTRPAVHQQIYELSSLPTIDVEYTWLLSPSVLPNPPLDTSRQGTAWVIFTSGSTGLPKGVNVSHASAIECILAFQDCWKSRNNRVLALSDFTFDASVIDWGKALSTGGTLCIAPQEQLLSNLAELAASFDIEFMHSTPTVASLFTPQDLPTLAGMSIGGESLTNEIRAVWRNEVDLYNVYGPTETTVIVLAHHITSGSVAVDTVGRPIGLNTLYVLDDRLKPVPLGCIGQLYISGPQVANGYINDAARTGKAFLQDPFSGNGSMMYSTGDFFRMNPEDHTFIFVGRRDTQVKINGVRIEIGEIEATLMCNPDVKSATVLSITIGERPTLVAFILPIVAPGPQETNSSSQTLVDSLKQVVRRKLPSAFWPTDYIVLTSLPLQQASGKLDKKALEALFHAHSNDMRLQRSKTELSNSLTSSQMKIMKLWQAALKTKECFDADASFVEVGGDSLSMMKLGGLAFKQKIPLTVAEQLKRPTLRQQAELVPVRE